jgi:hypothetical protein
MESKVVGSRELIQDLLSENGGSVPIDDIRDYAIGTKGNYTLVGTFMPTTVKGKLSYRRIEEELQTMKLIGEIDINKGIVKLRERSTE